MLTGYVVELRWFPSSGLGTPTGKLQLAVCREAGASNTAFPSWNLGTKQTMRAGTWERAKTDYAEPARLSLFKLYFYFFTQSGGGAH